MVALSWSVKGLTVDRVALNVVLVCIAFLYSSLLMY